MIEYDETDGEKDLYEADTVLLSNENDNSDISSDSESEPNIKSEHDGSAIESNHLNNSIADSLSDSSFEFVMKKTRKHCNIIESDSDESDNMSAPHNANKTGLHVHGNSESHSASQNSQNVISDSDVEESSETEYISEGDESYNIHEADTLELQNEIANISTELSKSKLSSTEITSKMLHSTLVEHQLDTPVNSSSGKRLLNKSIDTPRISKMFKESNTPRMVKPIVPALSPIPTPRLLNFSKEANTPRAVKPIILSHSPSPTNSCSDEDIIDASSEDENISKTVAKTSVSKIQKQTTLDGMFLKKDLPTVDVEQEVPYIQVSLGKFQQQQDKVTRIRSDLSKATNVLRTINMKHLPDKGESIINRHKTLEKMLMEEVKNLSLMKVTTNDLHGQNSQKNHRVLLSWDEIEAKAGAVQPKTFGKQAMSTYNAQKAVTMDRLQQLHGSLETCPKESDIADDPKGLKVDLMPHQRRALAWLMWRETQKPSGGILADDMGLGKTLTMISLMLKTNETEKDLDESDEDKVVAGTSKKKRYNGGTLVVCPASLINQWSGELERRTKRGLASCEIYHGPKRETNPKKLAQYDMVVTTYSIVNNECEKEGAIFRVQWKRIVIDEAHQIRNHKSQTSDAVCRLNAKSRWALTGTPVHNKELDMYALLKFLRCTPFDDLVVWKRWVGDKSTGGTERLHTVISSLMLRRTKAELIERGSLNSMPERKWELISVNLTKPERAVYSKILIFSRTLFAQFLHQRAEKNSGVPTNHTPEDPNQEYFQMRQKLLQMNNIKDVKQHEILVLLLRLRQICCHPSLITGMLLEDIELLGDEDEQVDKADALDFLDQLNKLTLNDDSHNPGSSSGAEGIGGGKAFGLKEAARGVLNSSDPIFSKKSLSSKITSMLKVLQEKVIPNKDKAIIVSQWSSYLTIISHHLHDQGIIYDQLDGSVPVPKRMAMVNRFNDPKHPLTVLLLSLTAGGVGLNLVGANHLLLLDLHWNPQLENQAQDRIYRLGQNKPVFVYKFMATDSIENRILELQEKKLSIANSMLTGTKQVSSKLSLQDLKMLFEM